MRYYFKAFKNYFECDGRATRKELWFFFLVHYIIVFVLSFLDGVFGFYSTSIPIDYGYMTLAYLLISFGPSVCVQIRRLHDVNKSGTWWLAFNLPLVGFYVLFLYVKRGDSGINDYGTPPIPDRYGRDSFANNVYDDPAGEDSSHYSSESTEPMDNNPMQIIYCHKCGKKLIEDSSFCRFCGTAIEKERPR